MGTLTEDQISAKITKISTAIDTILDGGRTYSISDGMGTQAVTRETLPNLEKSLEYWMDLYEREFGDAPAFVSIRTVRS